MNLKNSKTYLKNLSFFIFIFLIFISLILPVFFTKEHNNEKNIHNETHSVQNSPFIINTNDPSDSSYSGDFSYYLTFASEEDFLLLKPEFSWNLKYHVLEDSSNVKTLAGGNLNFEDNEIWEDMGLKTKTITRNISFLDFDAPNSTLYNVYYEIEYTLKNDTIPSTLESTNYVYGHISPTLEIDSFSYTNIGSEFYQLNINYLFLNTNLTSNYSGEIWISSIEDSSIPRQTQTIETMSPGILQEASFSGTKLGFEYILNWEISYENVVTNEIKTYTDSETHTFNYDDGHGSFEDIMIDELYLTHNSVKVDITSNAPSNSIHKGEIYARYVNNDNASVEPSEWIKIGEAGSDTSYTFNNLDMGTNYTLEFNIDEYDPNDAPILNDKRFRKVEITTDSYKFEEQIFNEDTFELTSKFTISDVTDITSFKYLLSNTNDGIISPHTYQEEATISNTWIDVNTNELQDGFNELVIDFSNINGVEDIVEEDYVILMSVNSAYLATDYVPHSGIIVPTVNAFYWWLWIIFGAVTSFLFGSLFIIVHRWLQKRREKRKIEDNSETLGRTREILLSLSNPFRTNSEAQTLKSKTYSKPKEISKPKFNLNKNDIKEPKFNRNILSWKSNKEKEINKNQNQKTTSSFNMGKAYNTTKSNKKSFNITSKKMNKSKLKETTNTKNLKLNNNNTKNLKLKNNNTKNLKLKNNNTKNLKLKNNNTKSKGIFNNRFSSFTFFAIFLALIVTIIGLSSILNSNITTKKTNDNSIFLTSTEITNYYNLENDESFLIRDINTDDYLLYDEQNLNLGIEASSINNYVQSSNKWHEDVLGFKINSNNNGIHTINNKEISTSSLNEGEGIKLLESEYKTSKRSEWGFLIEDPTNNPYSFKIRSIEDENKYFSSTSQTLNNDYDIVIVDSEGDNSSQIGEYSLIPPTNQKNNLTITTDANKTDLQQGIISWTIHTNRDFVIQLVPSSLQYEVHTYDYEAFGGEPPVNGDSNVIFTGHGSWTDDNIWAPGKMFEETNPFEINLNDFYLDSGEADNHIYGVFFKVSYDLLSNINNYNPIATNNLNNNPYEVYSDTTVYGSVKPTITLQGTPTVDLRSINTILNLSIGSNNEVIHSDTSKTAVWITNTTTDPGVDPDTKSMDVTKNNTSTYVFNNLEVFTEYTVNWKLSYVDFFGVTHNITDSVNVSTAEFIYYSTLTLGNTSVNKHTIDVDYTVDRQNYEQAAVWASISNTSYSTPTTPYTILIDGNPEGDQGVENGSYQFTHFLDPDSNVATIEQGDTYEIKFWLDHWTPSLTTITETTNKYNGLSFVNPLSLYNEFNYINYWFEWSHNDIPNWLNPKAEVYYENVTDGGNPILLDTYTSEGVKTGQTPALDPLKDYKVEVKLSFDTSYSDQISDQNSTITAGEMSYHTANREITNNSYSIDLNFTGGNTGVVDDDEFHSMSWKLIEGSSLILDDNSVFDESNVIANGNLSNSDISNNVLNIDISYYDFINFNREYKIIIEGSYLDLSFSFEDIFSFESKPEIYYSVGQQYVVGEPYIKNIFDVKINQIHNADLIDNDTFDIVAYASDGTTILDTLTIDTTNIYNLYEFDLSRFNNDKIIFKIEGTYTDSQGSQHNLDSNTIILG